MDDVKKIISAYISIPENEITSDTPIDNSVVKSSIILHRMYAALAEKGIVVENSIRIKTYGDLVSSLNSKPVSYGNEIVSQSLFSPDPSANQYSIGIDIQHVAELPVADDYRVHAFYQENFSPAEISYCITKPDPLQSFAGIFAAKEALIKADVSLPGKSFKTLEIKHSKDGIPYFGDFSVSISHGNGIAIAVALMHPAANNQHIDHSTQSESKPQKTRATALSVVSIILALISLIISVSIILNLF